MKIIRLCDSCGKKCDKDYNICQDCLGKRSIQIIKDSLLDDLATSGFLPASDEQLNNKWIISIIF